MKKVFGVGLIMMLFVSVGWGQQAELLRVVPMAPNLRVAATHITWFDTVLPLAVYIADANGNAYDFIEYQAGQVWYMYFDFLNGSTTAKAFKAEFNIYYSDGAGYANKRYALSAPAAAAVYYRVNVTAYIAKLNLITLVGRVYGTGMGNSNEVKTQVFVSKTSD